MENANIKGLSLTELAAQYEMSADIIRNWLKPFEKEIGEKQGRYYTPRQVKIIYKRLGPPDDRIDKE